MSEMYLSGNSSVRPSVKMSVKKGLHLFSLNFGLLSKVLMIYAVLWFCVFAALISVVPQDLFMMQKSDPAQVLEAITSQQLFIMFTIVIIYIAITFWFYGITARAYFITARSGEVVSISKLFTLFSVGESLRLYGGILMLVLSIIIPAVLAYSLCAAAQTTLMYALGSFLALLICIYGFNYVPTFVAHAIDRGRYGLYLIPEVYALMKGHFGKTVWVNLILFVGAVLLSLPGMVLMDMGYEFIDALKDNQLLGIVIDNTLQALFGWFIIAVGLTVSIAHYLELQGDSKKDAPVEIGTGDQDHI